MASPPVSGVHRVASSFQMEIPDNVQVLSEETLMQISKGPLGRFTRTCEDINSVNHVWQCLLKTFSTASISHSHTSAICNTLSAFLDAARISQQEATRQLALSRETWMSVFDVFLVRYKDSKPKPMKQLLDSLVGLLVRNQQETERHLIQSTVIKATIPSIMLGERRSQLKASLASLEILLRKNVFSPNQLVSMIDDWLRGNSERWISLFQDHCNALSIDTTKFLAGTSEDNSTTGFKRTSAEVFVLALMTQATGFDRTAGVGDLMSAFFQKIKSEGKSHSFSPEHARDLSIWVAPVRLIVSQNMDILESMSNYILQPMFHNDPSGFKGFIEGLPIKSVLTGDMSDAPLAELTLLFASLQMAKKIGLVHEDHYFPKFGNNPKDESDSALVLKSEIIGQFLFHGDFSIRIAALSLLISAPATTKPLSSGTMRAILKGLPSMHAESDSYSRGEILNLIRKLIARLKGGILSSEQNLAELKAPTNKKQPPVFARDDVETLACLTDYVEFLKADLRPTASYARHITSLRTLILLLDSGLDARFSKAIDKKQEANLTRWKLNIDIFQPSLLRLLADLLLDPFEEVRARSLTILNLFPRNILLAGGLQPESNPSGQNIPLLDALTKAENMASRTSRADYADTVARLYHILFCAAVKESSGALQWWETKLSVVDAILQRLEKKLSLTGALINSSLRDAPLHGYVAALRYIVSMPDFHSLLSGGQSTPHEAWRSVHTRIVSICDRIWDEVKPVLCIDSPEGHTDEPVDELPVGPKDILSYSWRALRESSLLLHATLDNSTYGPKGTAGLVYQDFEKIGTTSFTQLAELRHRGAFSTVSQTFATCCLRCGQSSDPEISALPFAWYQEGRKIIFETASKLTRRSGGLPALATGIVSSNPGGPIFQRVMDDLHEISHLPAEHNASRQDLELPQVHAMNCLKDIFTNTKLGPFTEPFIMPSLTLSAERLGSPIWTLRNSGLMLFRALLTRMCRTGIGLGFGGKSGSEPGARVSFQKYPGLLQLLSSLLSEQETRNFTEHGDHAIVTERVFPALELIAEKVPNVEDAEDQMLRELVQGQLGSPVWGIREHAARVYASLLNRSDILQDIQTLIDADRLKTQNFLHGKALCIKYALRRLAFTSLSLWNENIGEISSVIKRIVDVLFPIAESPFVATTLLEILIETVEKSRESGVEEEMVDLLDHIFDVHSLNDVLEFVLDSSHPSWKSLSTTRASSLLRRALSWAAILRIFVTGRFNELGPFFQTVSQFDANAGEWLLERMHEAFGENESHRKTLMDLYSSVTLGRYPEEVKSSAILYLATSLEKVLDFGLDKFHGIELPWQALDKQINPDVDTQIFNRDRSDAELRLQGCLLAGKVISNQCQTLETDISRWATKLRVAMQDETEFITRFAAVTSLAAFGCAIRPRGKTAPVDGIFLEIYLILYDMLNDDDEELRDIAASAASWVLSYSSVSPSKAVTLSSLNVCELLAKFIVDNYTASSILCTKTIRYVIGQEPRISGLTHRTKLASVSDLVTRHRQESTALFEEEKQNLFIDEVRDVDLWLPAFSKFTESSYDERLVKGVSEWVSEGLTYLIDTIAGGTGEDGFIGWASNPETFTLGIRVISLADVMASAGFPASKHLGEDQGILKEKLQVLYYHGKAASLHDNWLLRIKNAVDVS